MSENLPENTPPAYTTPAAACAAGCGSAAEQVPGKTLGIVGLVLAFLVPIVGLILSIVAVIQSRKAKVGNIPGIIGIIIGVLGSIIWIFVIVSIVSLAGMGIDVAEQCMNGAATVEVAGQTVSCSDVMTE